MVLPLNPPFRPMLAKLARTIPDGDGWLFEPKWDGFRCVVFRDGDDIELASRNERPFTRYFPELLDPLRAAAPGRAASSTARSSSPTATATASTSTPCCSASTPPSHASAGWPPRRRRRSSPSTCWRSTTSRSSTRRSSTAASACSRALHPAPPVYFTPASTDRATAEEWFGRFEGAGLDGVVAKRLDDPYQPDKRALVKVKHERTADCAVAGYRIHKDGNGVGSLLLGLYDDAGPACSTSAWRRRSPSSSAPSCSPSWSR